MTLMADVFFGCVVFFLILILRFGEAGGDGNELNEDFGFSAIDGEFLQKKSQELEIQVKQSPISNCWSNNFWHPKKDVKKMESFPLGPGAWGGGTNRR